MSFSFSLDWIMPAINTVADFARSGLPWNYRQAASNWIVFGAIFLFIAILFFALHFATREREKIAWNFVKTGHPVRLSWQRDSLGKVAYHIDGIEFSGENISGHELHQIDSEITLIRNQQKLPIFVIINGAWRTLPELDSIPPRALLSLGFSFRSDGLHIPEFSQRLTPSQFLRDIGGFIFSVSIDGKKQSWSFTIDELRNQFESQERESENEWFKNPLNRPQVKMKTTG